MTSSSVFFNWVRAARLKGSRSPTSGAIAVIEEHLWEFLERQGFKRGPVEIYGEMELLRLLDWFLDRAICVATEGYEQYSQLQD
jgi:hypothetical protein